MRAQHCPHCQLPIARSGAPRFPPAPMACPRCRLVIGPGRCKSSEAVEAAPASAGAAAGAIVSEARHADVEPVAREVVLRDVHAVAEARGVPVERLRMIDYDAAQREGVVPTELAVVLRTFGTWSAVSRAVMRSGDAPAGALPHAAAS